MSNWHKEYTLLALTNVEIGYQDQLKEIAMAEMSHNDYRIHYEVAFVGVGLGGGFKNMAELKIMKYNEAILANEIGRSKDVEEEHDRMVSNKVWIPTKLEDVLKGAIVLTSTWVMKKKYNGKLRARLNGRGYEQIDEMHYESSDMHVSVANNTTVRSIMVLALMTGWLGLIADF